MTNSTGYRRGTKDLFSLKVRKRGTIPLSNYMKVYKVGDIVDIKGNGAVVKGMPFKNYHGKTGRVYNITPHAVGVIINKRVHGRIIAKRINVRVEHVHRSKSREDFLNRVKENQKLRKEAKQQKVHIPLKRQPIQPSKAHIISDHKKPIFLTPRSYSLTIF